MRVGYDKQIQIDSRSRLNPLGRNAKNKNNGISLQEFVFIEVHI